MIAKNHGHAWLEFVDLANKCLPVCLGWSESASESRRVTVTVGIQGYTS